MAKLSKTTKTVIIAAAVLLVLGAVLLVLVMTSPKDSGSSRGRLRCFRGVRDLRVLGGR